ncbi:D-alanine--D-alanine ligase [Candidatus Falkowbacteria bacterium]|nr:D-alanine--D-alanine ligase [Candidatus Falkowbacteria bacterium]
MAKKLNSKKITVGVIFGGCSGEHEVSIASAQSVMKALDRTKYVVVPIGITKTGQWLTGSGAIKFLQQGLRLSARTHPALNAKATFLLPDPQEKKLITTQTSRGVERLTPGENIDVFMPILHGTYGEDGTIQGLLEMANKPYVGCGVLGSAVGMDKVIQKKILREAGLPVGPFDWFLKSEWRKSSSNILRRLQTLRYPLFVKPANLGSSVGISKVNNQKELIKAINLAAKFDRKIIVETGIKKPRELQCAVLGNDQPAASAIGEVVPQNEFYDFAAKYYDDKTAYYFPAQHLNKKQIAEARALAIKAFQALDMSGMARVEFFLSGKKLYLNEVNTIPGFTSHSIYPKLWEVSGLSYARLLDELIRLALERYNEKQQLSTDFSSGSDWYKG